MRITCKNMDWFSSGLIGFFICSVKYMLRNSIPLCREFVKRVFPVIYLICLLCLHVWTHLVPRNLDFMKAQKPHALIFFRI